MGKDGCGGSNNSSTNYRSSRTSYEPNPDRSMAPQSESEWREFWKGIRSVAPDCVPWRINEIIEEEIRETAERDRREEAERKALQPEREEYFRKQHYEKMGWPYKPRQKGERG